MEDQGRTIPFFVHEAEMDRHVKTHKRDFIEKILLILFLVLTNAGWLWYESQFEYVHETTIEAEQDGSGVNIIGSGDVTYGTEGENHTD